MKKRRALSAIILVIALLFEDPQFVKAELSSDAFSSFGCQLFYDDGFRLSNEKKEVYTVTYFLNGGTEGALTFHTYTEDELPVRLPIPSKPGYNFAGWYM